MLKVTSSTYRLVDWFSRLSIFLVYFWFGIIKVTGQSPASGLVMELQKVTLPFFDSNSFVVLLGLVEVIIGLMYLYKPLTRFATIVAVLHMFTTFLPLILLPSIAWTGFLIPTLEAQYILKNFILVALMLQIYLNYRRK